MAYQETSRQTIFNTKLTANDSTQKEALGAIREFEDGRAFRYVKMTGGTSVLGQVNTIGVKVAVTNATSASGVGPDGATTTIITDSDAAWTADAYVGWYYQTLTAMTGSTDPIKIVGNTATTLILEKSITTGLLAGGTDDGEIIAPLGVALIAAANVLVQPVSGVGIGALTENYYGWLQIRGYAGVLGDTLTEGYAICPGGNAAGQAIIATTNNFENVIGYVVAASGDNELNFCNLTIAA
jgi:hypothetical protein